MSSERDSLLPQGVEQGQTGQSFDHDQTEEAPLPLIPRLINRAKGIPRKLWRLRESIMASPGLVYVATFLFAAGACVLLLIAMVTQEWLLKSNYPGSDRVVSWGLWQICDTSGDYPYPDEDIR